MTRSNHLPTPAVTTPAPSVKGHPPDGLLRAVEVAHHLGVGIRTVWKLKSMRKLPAVSILGATRFRIADVARLAREGVE